MFGAFFVLAYAFVLGAIDLRHLDVASNTILSAIAVVGAVVSSVICKGIRAADDEMQESMFNGRRARGVAAGVSGVGLAVATVWGEGQFIAVALGKSTMVQTVVSQLDSGSGGAKPLLHPSISPYAAAILSIIFVTSYLITAFRSASKFSRAHVRAKVFRDRQRQKVARGEDEVMRDVFVKANLVLLYRRTLDRAISQMVALEEQFLRDAERIRKSMKTIDHRLSPEAEHSIQVALDQVTSANRELGAKLRRIRDLVDGPSERSEPRFRLKLHGSGWFWRFVSRRGIILRETY